MRVEELKQDVRYLEKLYFKAVTAEVTEEDGGVISSHGDVYRGCRPGRRIRAARQFLQVYIDQGIELEAPGVSDQSRRVWKNRLTNSLTYEEVRRFISGIEIVTRANSSRAKEVYALNEKYQ